MSEDIIDSAARRGAIAARPGARVRTGSDEHKELFCRTFIDTHLIYEPQDLPWPELDEVSLARLRAIPIWSTALQLELNAGQMVTDFAATLRDPLIREAVALQGAEEKRHSRMVGALVERYGLNATSEEPKLEPTENAFVTFGYRECLDSFLGFGIFRLAREANFLPDSLISLFRRVMVEEARHIVFFINWIAYERVRRGYGFPLFQALATVRGYGAAFLELVHTNREAKEGAEMFQDGDAFGDLTLAKFFEACLAENTANLAALDPRLLRPRVMPTLATIALGAIHTGERLKRIVRR